MPDAANCIIKAIGLRKKSRAVRIAVPIGQDSSPSKLRTAVLAIWD